MVRKLCRIIQD